MSTTALGIEEERLRERIRIAGEKLPGWSWTVDELRLFAGLLDSIIEAREQDGRGNVVYLAGRRYG